MVVSIFGDEIPDVRDNADGFAKYTLGTRFQVTAPGKATHSKWYFPQSYAGVDTAVVGGIFKNTELQGTTTYPLPNPLDGWYTSAFSTPIALEPGIIYTAAIWTPNRYVYTSGYTWPKTSGALLTDSPAGRYAESESITFPDNSFGTPTYFADLLFVADDEEETPDGPTVFVWNGTAEISATITTWNGTTEISANVEIKQA